MLALYHASTSEMSVLTHETNACVDQRRIDIIISKKSSNTVTVDEKCQNNNLYYCSHWPRLLCFVVVDRR